MENKLINYAIILASGSGSRFESDIPKQFVKIGDRTILEITAQKFEIVQSVDRIIIVVNSEYLQKATELLRGYKKIYKIIPGGKTRKDSSYNAVSSIDDSEANILIHDGVRPFVTPEIINDCINALNNGTKALTTAIPSTDTIIEVKDDKIISIPKRETLQRVQTPQGFKLSLIRKAHELSKYDYDFTDDCGLVLRHKLADISIIKGSNDNIKITYPNDINIDN